MADKRRVDPKVEVTGVVLLRPVECTEGTKKYRLRIAVERLRCIVIAPLPKALLCDLGFVLLDDTKPWGQREYDPSEYSRQRPTRSSLG